LNHVIAVLGLAAVCALWVVVQRWAGRDAGAACDECEQPGCARRDGGDPIETSD
jgi:hypothetical protein